MAATAPGNLRRDRATRVQARPVTGSEVSIADTTTPGGVKTALGIVSDPSLPVIQGIAAGGAGGVATMGIALALMRDALAQGPLNAFAPIVLLLGFLLGGGIGGLGGLLLLLTGNEPRRAFTSERDHVIPQP